MGKLVCLCYVSRPTGKLSLAHAPRLGRIMGTLRVDYATQPCHPAAYFLLRSGADSSDITHGRPQIQDVAELFARNQSRGAASGS